MIRHLQDELELHINDLWNMLIMIFWRFCLFRLMFLIVGLSNSFIDTVLDLFFYLASLRSSRSHLSITRWIWAYTDTILLYSIASLTSNQLVLVETEPSPSKVHLLIVHRYNQPNCTLNTMKSREIVWIFLHHSKHLSRDYLNPMYP